MAIGDKCRNCIYMDFDDRDGINSKKCYCSKRDTYYYPDEPACGDYTE